MVASGAYFTKDFAVAHLLDQALEPALVDHCRRLDALDEEVGADAFFDFPVADISMRSAHLFVAAVDETFLNLRNAPLRGLSLASFASALIFSAQWSGGKRLPRNGAAAHLPCR